MSTIRSRSVLLALTIVGSACGADPAVPDGAAFAEEAPSSSAEVETSEPVNLFLPTADQMPERLHLVSAGDLDGPTVQPAGKLPDGATWDGQLTMSLSLDESLGWTQPLVDVGFSVVVDQIAADEWRYLTSYSDASVTEAVGGVDPENSELAQELMASYAKLSFISVVDSFGVTAHSEIVGIERLPVAYQLDVSDFADQVSDLSTPVAAGELGVGAVWTEERTSDIFYVSTPVIYTYEIVAIDGSTYTMDFSFSALGAGQGGLDISASGTIVADEFEPIPLNTMFTVSANLPVGLDDPASQDVTIDVVLEGR